MSDNEYRALTGINYKHKDTGKDARVEKGDKIEGLNDIALRNELAAGNVEILTDAPVVTPDKIEVVSTVTIDSVKEEGE